MLQALISDIGNVLLAFDFTEAYRKIADLSDGFNEDAMLVVEQVKQACEAGQIDRLAFEQGVIEALRFRGEPREFSSLWADIFTINQPMVDFVESLHGKMPLFLLSNTNAIHLDHIIEKYPFFRLFDDAIYSHEVKLAKPDPAIFRLARDRFGVLPERTAFIDDMLANVKAAREVGFRGLHYEMRDHDVIIAEIKSLLP